MTNTTDSDRIETILQQAAEGGYRDLKAREAIVQTGVTDDRRFVPQLKQIAAETSRETNSKVTYDALDSLWRLGEPKEYFLDNARAHEQNKWLAYYSLLLLGRDPDDERSQEVMAEIKARSTDNQIRGAIAEAGRLRAIAGEYDQLATDEEKIDFVLARFRGGWDPISFGLTEIGSSVDPLGAWARSQLLALSQKHPELVAQAVRRIDLSDQYEDPSFTRSYRNYVAQFIAPEAQQRLQEMGG